jgi:Ca-activated chloride channel family protein
MFRIQHTEYLFGLVAIPLLGALFYLLIQWKKQAAARMGDPVLVEQLVKNFSPLRFLIKFVVAMLAFAIVVLGAGNLQKPGAMQNVHRQGVDVMMVLDVSKSMLSRDSKPNRLEKAKQLLTRLTDKLDNDRLGMVLFAGRAYMQMPLTTDHGAAKMYIQDASPDVVPTQGTVIAEALRMANSSFNAKEHKYKAVVLVSDGEDHDPDALKVAKTLAQDGVMINTVGIGTPEGSPIEDPATGELKKDEQGNTVISKLNEAELQQLADVSKGEYIRLDNMDDALITLTQQLGSIEKKSLSDAEYIDYESYFQWFLALALLLLLAEFFLPERKRKGSGRIPRLVGAVCMMAVSLQVAGQQSDALVRKGNRLYKQKQLARSQKAYEEAVHAAPGDATANYNLGDVLFRQNNFDSAAKSFGAGADNSRDSSSRENSLYNKGVALVKGQKLKESIDAWEKALKINPSDQETRENLQKALLEFKRQQQQQQQDQKKKQDQQQQKKQDQKDQQQQPQPQPSKLTRQQAEQLLKSLQERENELQKKMNQNKTRSSNQPDKDW